MRVLVTGAAGFLGRHLVPALAAAEHEVHALVRPGSAAPGAATQLEADLSRPLDGEALPAADAVVHLAQANVPFPERAGELHRVNAGSTADLLAWAQAQGAERFVFASTGLVYGYGDAPFAEEAPLAPPDFYSLTKAHGEAIVRAFADVRSTIVRPFALYGPGQTGRLVPTVLERVRRGEPVTLRGPDGLRINPLYVDDAVAAVLALLEREDVPVLNLAGDDPVTIRALATAAAGVVGREARFEELEPDGASGLVGANARLAMLLGRPFVTLADGLARTAEASH